MHRAHHLLVTALLLTKAAGRYTSHAAMCSSLKASLYSVALPASLQLRGGGRVRQHREGASSEPIDSTVRDKEYEDAEAHEYVQRRGDSENSWSRGLEGDKPADRNGSSPDK
jgi:hypothetical protein